MALTPEQQEIMRAHFGIGGTGTTAQQKHDATPEGEAGEGPKIGDTKRNSRGQLVEWNGSRWAIPQRRSPTVTGRKTDPTTGRQTTIEYTDRGVNRTTRDREGNIVSEQRGLSMEENRQARHNDRRERELRRLAEVGATGYWSDTLNKLVITDAQGNKYAADSIFSAAGDEQESDGTGTTIWAQLRRAAGMSPTIRNPWYEGPNPPLGPPTDHVPPDGKEPPVGPPAPPDPGPPDPGPPGPPGPPGGPPTGPVNPPMPNPPQDPLPDPRPEDGPPQFPDTDQEYLFPVFSNQSRDPKELFDDWMANRRPELLEGYGPQNYFAARDGAPQDTPPPDVGGGGEEGGGEEGGGGETEVDQMFGGDFEPSEHFADLITQVGFAEAMRLFYDWIAANPDHDWASKYGSEFPNDVF